MTGQQPLPHMPPLPLPPPAISERDLQKGIIDVARILGYKVSAFRPAQTMKGWRTAVQGDGAGWPDLCLVGHGRVLFRELKVGKNTLSDEQAEWIRALEEAGADVGVWTDADWFAGLIEAELKREPGRAAA